MSVLQKGQIRAGSQFLGSILAFRLPFGLERADVGQGLLSRQLYGAVR